MLKSAALRGSARTRRIPDPLMVTQALWEMQVAQKERSAFVPGLLADSDYLLQYVRGKTVAVQSALVKAFSQLDDTLRSEVTALREAGRPVPLYIPAIAALVLSGAQRKEAFASVTLSLRADFADTRRRFQEYENVICDDAIPLAESLSALRRLEASLAQLTSPTRPSDIRNAEEWKDAGTLVKAGLEGLSTEDSAGLFKLLVGKPAAELSRYLKRRDVMYLSDVRTKFLDIRGYGQLLSSKLGLDLNSADFEMARQYLATHVRRHLPRR